MQNDQQPRRLLTRGGARNRRDRVTDRLTPAQCCDLLDVANAAWDDGQPLNRFITLAWELGGIDPRENCNAIGAFIKLASDWARRHGFSLAWAWVQEGGKRYGAHVHLLMHIPPHLDPVFRTMPLRWAKTILRGAYASGVVDCLRIRGAVNNLGNPELYWRALEAKLHYMLKAAPPELKAQMGMTGLGSTKWGKYCKVFGKRAGQAVWLRKRAKFLK